MKKLVAVLPFLVLLAAQNMFAANYPIGIGPFLMLKAGTNAASIPEGYKTGVVLNGLPDFGVSAYFPVSKTSAVGAVVDLGYSTYAFGERRVIGDEEGDLYKYQFSYLTLSPSLYLSSFLIGLDVGIPMSGALITDDDDFEVNTDNIATMLEVHIGGMIPVVENRDGRLNILLRGGYMLTGVFDNLDDSSDKYNPKAATLGFGLNYYFNLQ
jgi:hypothetical protein